MLRAASRTSSFAVLARPLRPCTFRTDSIRASVASSSTPLHGPTLTAASLFTTSTASTRFYPSLLPRPSPSFSTRSSSSTIAAEQTPVKPKRTWRFLRNFVLTSLAGVTGSVLFVAYEQPGTHTPLARLRIGAESMRRFFVTLWTGIKVIADYKLTWARFPAEHPLYAQETSKLHQRAADRLLALCLLNGGLYIKAGQYIASLNHVLPREFTATLSVLQDKAPTISYEQVQRVFKEDLGVSIEDCFLEFNPVPLAAASVAQVHHAVTKDGREVAVKVQYPYISEQFAGDMWSHQFSLHTIEFFFPQFEFSWIGEEIEVNLKKELDFENEAENARRAARDLREMQDVYIPPTYKELSSKRILTMEFIHGCKITNLEALARMRADPKKAMNLVVEVLSRQVFLYGHVHCDPHPGNIFVRVKDGRTQIVLLDHGLYKDLSPQFRHDYAHIWHALVLHDDAELKKHCARIGVEHWELFAVILLMRSYRGARPGFSGRMQPRDHKRMQRDFQATLKKVVQTLKSMPRELVLVLRSHNLVRSIEKELGAPVNRFAIMAHTAALALSAPTHEALTTWELYTYRVRALRDSLAFSFRVRMSSFWYWLTDNWMRVLYRVGAISVNIDALEDQISASLR